MGQFCPVGHSLLTPTVFWWNIYLWASIVYSLWFQRSHGKDKWVKAKVQAEKEALTIPQLKMSTRFVSCHTLMKSSGRYAAEAWKRWVFIMVYFDLLLIGHRWAIGWASMGVKFWSSKTLELWKRKQSPHFGLDKKRLPWKPFLKNNLAVSSVGPSKSVTEDLQCGVSEPVLKGVPTPINKHWWS